jgi:hypothetical protein
MRTVIAFAVIGLTLGLAAQWLPRALGQDAPAAMASDMRPTPPSLGARFEPQSSSQPRLALAASASGGGASSGNGSSVAQAPVGERRVDTPTGSAEERDPVEVVESLRAAGLPTSRAREIVQREAALRDEAISVEFAATGTIRPLNGSAQSVARQKLRKELGDEVYEKYVEAKGRPLRVRIGRIESDSPAANAGLLSGDEIVSYGGRRVFDPGELSAMTQATSIGETVPMTVVREGQTMTLYATGGPLGISQRAVR